MRKALQHFVMGLITGFVLVSSNAFGQSSVAAQRVDAFLSQIQIPPANIELTKQPTCKIQAYQLPTEFEALKDAKWNPIGGGSSEDIKTGEKRFIEIQYAEISAFVLDEIEQHGKLITSASTAWGNDAKCSAEWKVPAPKSTKKVNKIRSQSLTVGQDRSRSKEKKFLSVDFRATESEMGKNTSQLEGISNTSVTTVIGFRGDMIALRFHGDGNSSIVTIVKLINVKSAPTTPAGVVRASADQALGVPSNGLRP